MPVTIKCAIKAKKAKKAKKATKKKKTKKTSTKKAKKATNKSKCSGKDWRETFHSCVKGDGRKFNAWVKGLGYQQFKGACANSKGKYGKRHKFHRGKFSFQQCKAKCDEMGKTCQGITMPVTIKCAANKAAKKKKA